MRSHTTRRFRDSLVGLPGDIQRQSRAAYRLFQQNPHHPGLRFKRIHPRRPIYSVRISAGYRAIGVRDGDEMIWFWIGSHADYDAVVVRL